MPLQMKSLSPSAIEGSKEIGRWLSQFPAESQKAAVSLLSRLRFVSRDVYSEWLLVKLGYLAANGKCAVYSVREIKNQKCLWDNHGDVVGRPGNSQGSEDLVYSLIANAARKQKGAILDNPSLSVLKEEQIHNIVLLDDSIGSGNRVAGFIRLMMAHRSFRSWWSLGFIKLYIVSLARTRESKWVILKALPGSEHWKRKHRKSSKILFLSDIVYGISWLESRWGKRYQDIVDLCDSQTAISKDRRGYGGVMASIVFYHSVPNNTPGVIWCKKKNWNPLFPGRAVPDWLLALLDDCERPAAEAGQVAYATTPGIAVLPAEMFEFLSLIKLGVRRTSSLALRMDLDTKFTGSILQNAIYAGFVSENGRITEAGITALKRQSATSAARKVDRSLYVPQSWCSDQASIQPPALAGQADPAEVEASTGGDARQVSLERTDVTTTSSSSMVRPQAPSKSRKGPDHNGPLG